MAGRLCAEASSEHDSETSASNALLIRRSSRLLDWIHHHFVVGVGEQLLLRPRQRTMDSMLLPLEK